MLSRLKKASEAGTTSDKVYRSVASRFRESKERTPPPTQLNQAEVPEEPETESLAPTPLYNIKLHFIVENSVAKQEVYEHFNFSTNGFFTVGVDPYSLLAQSSDALICFCESPLGPSLDNKTFAGQLCQKLGPKFQMKVADIVRDKFFGEIPPSTVFSITQTVQDEDGAPKKRRKIYFVTVESENPLFAYHAYRAAFLQILDSNRTFRRSASKSGGTKSRHDRSSVRGFWNDIDRQAQNLAPATHSTSTSVLSLSRENKCDSPTGRPISITIPVHQCFSLSNTAIVYQMAMAYKSVLYFPGNSPADPIKLLSKYENLKHILPSSEEKSREQFLGVVMRKELIRRGIIGIREKEWLLSWIADNSNPELHSAAINAFVAYIQTTRSAQPTDIQPHELLRDAFKTENCLQAILNSAAEGEITLHREIPVETVQKEKEIGKGGTATVYTASFEGQTVALKEFVSGTNLKEFRREVALMRLLNHPCLVNIIGAGFSDGGKIPFILSEYVAKGDLYGLLHSPNYSQISEKTIYEWAMDIACGMLYLHEHSIIHRDLKSLNVLVTADDRCKIIDYGASRVKSSTNTNMTGNIGTLFWMAPEMFQTNTYTEKIDVYSFSIVLFELLTGELPYQNENSFSLPVLVTKGLRPTIPKTVPKPWVKLMTQCWNDKPSKRPGFDRIVQQLVALKPVDPAPPPA